MPLSTSVKRRRYSSETVPTDSVRVTMNNFLATGGDGFSVFKEGTNQLGGEVDVDAFGRYLMAHSPLSPPPYLTAPRITRVD